MPGPGYTATSSVEAEPSGLSDSDLLDIPRWRRRELGRSAWSRVRVTSVTSSCKKVACYRLACARRQEEVDLGDAAGRVHSW
jgi:hypothetical protein